MNPFEFLGWNIIGILVIVLIIVIYLTSIINRRRKKKFLHDKPREQREIKPPDDSAGT
jgi:hypothetical protein